MAAGVTLSSWGRVSIHKVPWEVHVTSCGGCGVPLHVVLMVAVVETPCGGPDLRTLAAQWKQVLIFFLPLILIGLYVRLDFCFPVRNRI